MTLLERTGDAVMHPEARERLRQARIAAGLSLRELGKRIGLSASLLSQIENGKSDPSVSSLYALVTELGLSLDALLVTPSDDAGPGAPTHAGVDAVRSPVLRPGARRVLEMDSGVIWEQLTPGPDSQVDALLVTYEPGGTSSSTGKLMTHTGIEYAYLIEGELTLRLGFDTHTLRAGDSLVFAASKPHLYANLGVGPACGVWFVLGGKNPHEHVGTSVPGERASAPSVTSAVEVLEAFNRR